MKIAFDLDGTLLTIFPGQFVLQEPIWPMRIVLREKLRVGAPALLRQLQADGHELWVYTSSFRSALYIRWIFISYGVWLAGVVNADAHEQAMRGQTRWPSKYPPAFAIDVLIDDSEGVQFEGSKYGFRVIRIAPEDSTWVRTVLQAI